VIQRKMALFFVVMRLCRASHIACRIVRRPTPPHATPASRYAQTPSGLSAARIFGDFGIYQHRY
jgi:hypothetical protein